MNNLEEIVVNNVKQWIYVTGTNPENPILLVLHGGPGFAMLPLFHEKIPDLEKYFTVVNWDQRGAGKSFAANIPKSSMTLDQMVEDAHVVTQYLQKKYKQDRVYLLGHSSGTMIGVLLAKRYPEDYYAYIGVGQVVNFADNESGSYQFALQSAIDQHNKTALTQLEKAGKPDKDGNYKNDKSYDVTAKWVEHFGGSLYGKSNLDPVYDLIFGSETYNNCDKKLLKGYDFSQYLFNDEAMRTFNLPDAIQALPIPAYFISGHQDYETPVNLVRDIVASLDIPRKRYIEFTQSSHFPFYEEPEKFVKVMRDILDETQGVG